MALGLAVASATATAASSEELRCIEASARYNRLPPALLLAVRLQEAGRTGYWRRNADGSFDYGVMQINSRWLPMLEPQGYTATVLVYNGCASIEAGAWILAWALASQDSWNRADAQPAAYWRGVGDYHSHTPTLNRGYAEQVWARYRRDVQGDLQ